LENLPPQEFFKKKREKRENTASPFLTMHHSPKNSRAIAMLWKVQARWTSEEPKSREPNHRNRSYHGWARIGPFRKWGLRGTLTICLLNWLFIILFFTLVIAPWKKTRLLFIFDRNETKHARSHGDSTLEEDVLQSPELRVSFLQRQNTDSLLAVLIK
jgi:hypothetical protein